MIELKNVSKFYSDNGTVTVGLKDINLKFNKGEFVAITGDSGSGKSTLLNVISSIDTYDEGEILFYGNETFYFNQNDSDTFRKNNVSFIFQKYNIIDSYTVLENVMLPLLIKGKSRSEARGEALRIIDRVGLGKRIHNRGAKLSGGEKQRCVIARALASDAPILACDEPTGNLDSKTGAEIISLIKEVSGDKLVLIVTHDYEAIMDVCTRKIKLSDGEIVEDVTFAEGKAEEDRELVLETSKPKRRTLLGLALLNILSTPKKTVFSSLVFTFVSFILLLLSLLMVKTAYDENYSYSDSYGIISDDRLIIYSSDHEPLDMSRLEPILKDREYYVNAFYEESTARFSVGDLTTAYGALTFHDIDCEILNGTADVGEGEFVLIMPSFQYSPDYARAIGETLSITANADHGYTRVIGTLAGVGISDDVNYFYIRGASPDQSLINTVLNNNVSFSFDSSGVEMGIFSLVYDKELETPYFAIPKELEGKIDLNFNLGDIYSVSYDFEIVYTDEVISPKLFVNTDYIYGNIAPKVGGVREITVYTDDIKSLSGQVKRAGYDTSTPSAVEKGEGASLIVLYLLIIVVIIALVIMFFISFAVLQRLYLTKAKDYSIFRTLGLCGKDLKKVLFIEVLAVTAVSTVIGSLLAYAIITLAELELYKYVSVTLILLYVLAMLALAGATALRLNGKIFKSSVYRTLKEGDE